MTPPFEGATYDPAQLKIMGQAFDEAWLWVEPTVGAGASSLSAARTKLARAIFKAAGSAQGQDAASLSARALKLLFPDDVEARS